MSARFFLLRFPRRFTLFCTTSACISHVFEHCFHYFGTLWIHSTRRSHTETTEKHFVHHYHHHRACNLPEHTRTQSAITSDSLLFGFAVSFALLFFHCREFVSDEYFFLHKFANFLPFFASPIRKKSRIDFLFSFNYLQIAADDSREELARRGINILS